MKELETSLKLTPKQNAVIWCLQNGWEIIAGSESSWVTIANSDYEYKITSALFWKLTEEYGLIQQNMYRNRWDWELSEKGKIIKTKPVEFK